jgi:hypothetical protein
MSGLLNKLPWPNDAMTSVFVVDRVGNTFVDKSNGQVLSLQPDGSWQDRVPGTAGAYEVNSVNGALAVFNPTGTHATGFLYWPDVPNV